MRASDVFSEGPSHSADGNAVASWHRPHSDCRIPALARGQQIGSVARASCRRPRHLARRESRSAFITACKPEPQTCSPRETELGVRCCSSRRRCHLPCLAHLQSSTCRSTLLRRGPARRWRPAPVQASDDNPPRYLPIGVRDTSCCYPRSSAAAFSLVSPAHSFSVADQVPNESSMVKIAAQTVCCLAWCSGLVRQQMS